MTTQWLGDQIEDALVSFIFTTHEAAGGNVAPDSAFEAADIRIYKNGSAVQRSSSSGITMTSPFDSLTGVHCVEIDTSDNTDTGFYAAGSLYHVVLVPDTETIDGQTVYVVLANFGIVKGAAAVLSAANAGYIGIPSNLGGGATLADNLSTIYDVVDAMESTIGAAGAGLTAVPWNAAWDAEVQSEANDALVANNLDHLLAASVSGTDVVDNSVIAKIVSKSATADWDSFANTTDALEALRDNAGTNGDSLSVGIKTGGIVASSFAPNAIDATAIAANAIGASELASDVITDIWQGTALTEAYATDGAEATPAQLLHMIWAMLAEKAVSGTTVTVKKLDGSTPAMTFTLSDATNPTSITRAS